MEYQLIKATDNDIAYLKNAKLYSIFEYANNLSVEEISKIKDYVDRNIPTQLEKYRMIKVSNGIVGCLLIKKNDDGSILLDEIYLEKEYRNRGIGTNIIKNILLKNKIVYLWVYIENKKAISLYEKLSFKIMKKTDIRYFMEYEATDKN